MSVLDLLQLQDAESVKNTFYRAPKVSPSIFKVSNDLLQVRTADVSVDIRSLEESILYIVASFKFLPYWLVQRWYDEINNQKGVAKTAISSWIAVGLVWLESSSTGLYLRPTRFLLDMFGEENVAYFDIPYGLLTHTISEEQICFDMMVGNEKSELWQLVKDEKFRFPRFHPLLKDIQNDFNGTVVVREADFRLGFRRLDNNSLIELEDNLRREIKESINTERGYTSELIDFYKFPIIKFNTQEQANKGEIITQTPDCLIPMPRYHGKAMSYAIEIELSAKTPEKYDGIMHSYKNNNRYGKLFYLCGNQRIAKMVRDAYRKIGGLGTCELFIVPYTPPSYEVDNFDYEQESIQSKLLLESRKTYD